MCLNRLTVSRQSLPGIAGYQTEPRSADARLSVGLAVRVLLPEAWTGIRCNPGSFARPEAGTVPAPLPWRTVKLFQLPYNSMGVHGGFVWVWVGYHWYE